MTGLPEDTGHHLIRSDCCTNNFRWIWIWSHTVDCCFVSGTYAQIHDSSPVTILYSSFNAPTLYFYNISLDQSTRTFFGAILEQREQTFLSARCSFKIECMLGQKCPRIILSLGMSHDDLALSVHERHQSSLAQRSF